METKHLESASFAKPVVLPAESTEITVPAGAHHYHIVQGNTQTEYIFHLVHPESSVKVTGMIRAGKTETPDLTTKLLHHAPRTKAETLIRTLASEQAKPRYQGLIKIDEHAQNCESYLNHHSLLLGEEASSWTLPSLEIGANEVKCSHAATVRTITDHDIFYLRSRGIPSEQARTTLIEAFFSDVQI